MAVLFTKTPDEIRDDILRTYKAELYRRGITNPNTSWGTEIYIKATALANQIYLASQNAVIEGDALMPDTAQGDDLIRRAGSYGLSLKPASGSSGKIILSTTISTSTTILISSGIQLQDQNGLNYQTTITGNYKNSDKFEIAAIDTGVGTNLAAGSVLRWVSIPPFAAPTVTVAFDLVGGGEAETIEGLRTRLLNKLANNPGGGNWAQVIETAEASSPEIQKAFCYPACNGPSTCGVAVTSAPTDTYKGRDFAGDLTVLNLNVIPDLIAEFPEFADFITTYCQNDPIDVSIGLSLPPAKNASPAGNGTGWLDGSIFPLPIMAAGAYVTGYCDVTAVTSSSVFTVNADSSMSGIVTAGSTVNVCWLSKNDWILRTAKAIVTAGVPPTSFIVTLTADSTPFADTTGVTIQTGDWIFPAALNMETYITTLLGQFALLGPGEKIDPVTVSGLMPRAHRRPVFQDSWACDMGPSVLKFVENSGSEVLDVQYLYRTPEPVTGLAGKCPVPASVMDGPYILTPKNLGFYPIL